MHNKSREICKCADLGHSKNLRSVINDKCHAWVGQPYIRESTCLKEKQ